MSWLREHEDAQEARQDALRDARVKRLAELLIEVGYDQLEPDDLARALVNKGVR